MLNSGMVNMTLELDCSSIDVLSPRLVVGTMDDNGITEDKEPRTVTNCVLVT